MKANNDIFNTIVDQAKKVALSEKEKATLFRSIDAYVRKHPVKGAAPQPVRRPVSSPVPSRWITYLGANHSAAISFALVVFVVLGAGTSSAAQRALPGDLLYAVKTGINEQVHALFLSGVNKTNFEATRAVERVKEAQALATQGKLTEAVSAQLSADFDTHAAQVQKDVEVLKQKGELTKVLDVTDHFESALKEQAAQTETPGTLPVSQNNEGSAPETVVIAGSLAEKVQTAIKTAATERATTEDAVVATGAPANDIRKLAETKRADVLTLVASVQTKMVAVAPAPASVPTTMLSVLSIRSAKTVAPVVQKNKNPVADLLVQVQSLVTLGDAARDAGKFTEAFTFYRNAYELARHAGEFSTQ